MFVGLLSVPHLFSIEMLYIGPLSPYAVFSDGLSVSLCALIRSLIHTFGNEEVGARNAFANILGTDNIARQVMSNFFAVVRMVK